MLRFCMTFFDKCFDRSDDARGSASSSLNKFQHLASSPVCGTSGQSAKFVIRSLEQIDWDFQDTDGRLKDRILHWSKVSQDVAEYERSAELATERCLAIMVPALRAIGARRLYCRYDGASNEGFESWLDHAVLSDGTRVDAPALKAWVRRLGLLSQLYEAEVIQPILTRSDKERIHEMIDTWLCQDFARMLHGKNLDTQECRLLGAFTVDLEQCHISDDPTAQLVVRDRKNM